MNEPKGENEQIEEPPELTPEDDQLLDEIWDNLDNENKVKQGVTNGKDRP